MGALPLKIFPQALKISRGVILGLSWAVVICFRCSVGVPGCFLPETELLTFFQKIQNSRVDCRNFSAGLEELGSSETQLPGDFRGLWPRCMPRHAPRNLAVS